ncbi:doxx family protein [Flagellimonas lutaonensis]|uniref:doxx family protein n=1 Tax=Flagellimonas lutaonensis TaxID=516051 RepID=UPI001FE21BF9|nr:doxx family protein [Allomuricauda lutaonensis]
MKNNIKKAVRHVSKNHVLAVSIGFVYVWFGALKFFPNTSPAKELAKNTIHSLTFGVLPDEVSILLLATLEVLIGALLMLNVLKRQAIALAIGHIIFTFTPLIFFPLESFKAAPLVPTLLGQYIGKNVIILGALITLARMHMPLSSENIEHKS